MAYTAPYSVAGSEFVATNRVCNLDNWVMLKMRQTPEWYFIQNDEASVLLRVDTIFNDYGLFHCDWHTVLSADWCAAFPELRRKLIAGYANWTMKMFALSGVDDDE